MVDERSNPGIGSLSASAAQPLRRRRRLMEGAASPHAFEDPPDPQGLAPAPPLGPQHAHPPGLAGGSGRTRPLRTRNLWVGSVSSWPATCPPPPSANGSACWRRAEHVCLVRRPRVYQALGATDLRQGFDALYALVEQGLALMDRGRPARWEGRRSRQVGAAAYALGLWPRLVRFVEYGELELSTNLAENALSGVALGRKNWIHVGSAEAGPKVAAILSVLEISKRLALDLRAYLADVLPRLATTSIQRVGELTPARRAASRGG